MSTLRNRVQLIGHLGANPEVKTFNNGSQKATVSIATNESYQQNGEWKEETQWHNLAFWGTMAERAERQLSKGSYVLIEGKLTYNKYEDAKGEMRYFTEIRVQNFILLDKKPGEES